MREVVITGIGLVSCAGEGVEAHIEALRSGATPPVDAEAFAPYPVHPVARLEWDRQIPKKSDQRQMEPWQRLGVYAAGLALDAANAKADSALKSRMHLIVAAGGGERDYAADAAILTGLRTAENPGIFLNERLMSDLRPTLFLAQLSNLLAGNIAIVHGVTGASRTFMGEEQSGVDAIRTAHSRIAAGQNDVILVGGSYNAERPDALLVYAMAGHLWRGAYKPVFERAPEGGFILGSGACFLVLESRRHADDRGAEPLAALAGVAVGRVRREPGAVSKVLQRFWTDLGARSGHVTVSGATGTVGITTQEIDALHAIAPETVLHATGDATGHMMEAQAPAGVAIAAGFVAAGSQEAFVTSIGHRRGEGAVRLVRPA